MRVAREVAAIFPAPSVYAAPMGISTHVLDTARGKPAAGVSVSLEVRSRGPEGDSWKPVRAS